MCLVFTRTPGESYHRQLRSLLLCLCDVSRTQINSLVGRFFTRRSCVANEELSQRVDRGHRGLNS